MYSKIYICSMEPAFVRKLATDHLVGLPQPQHMSNMSSRGLLLLTPITSSLGQCERKLGRQHGVVVAAGLADAAWKPKETAASSPSSLLTSDVLWPSAGAFAAMALLGKIDQLILAPKGMIPMSIAPLGAVSVVLFAAPSSPAARKYNMFMAQIGCAAIGVLAYSLFGPGWLARSVALSASIAFMILTSSTHPPAASLPILFIDGVKLHRLNFWYAFFPGAAGCIILCFMQQIVSYLKENFKF